MTLIYFIFVLGITIMIHEFGHFLFAKKAGVYIYEFSLGMGPKLFQYHSKKDETVYSIRLLPIGGYVSMAGEDAESEDDVPKEKQMCNKSWIQRFLILIAGVCFNFILAIILLFVVALVEGVPATKPYISIDGIDSTYPIMETNMKTGDLIVAVENKKITSVDRLVLELQIHTGDSIDFMVLHKNGEKEIVTVSPKKVETESGTTYQYGISILPSNETGVLASLKYAIIKTKDLIGQMGMIIGYLVTGKLGFDNLAGPIGIFNLVGETARAGFMNILFLISYLCINVGLLNIIPLPAFDGGRLLFLVIEKIKGSRVSPKVENIFHSVGFIFLMILMLVVSYNDILRLFK